LIDEIYQEILELEKEIEDEKYDGCKWVLLK
jgi:hypothetical protein